MLAHLVRLHHAGHKRKVFVMDNSEQKQLHVCGDCALAVWSTYKLPFWHCIFATAITQSWVLCRLYGHMGPLSRRAHSLQLHNIRLTWSRETTSRDGQRLDRVDLAKSYLRMGLEHNNRCWCCRAYCDRTVLVRLFVNEGFWQNQDSLKEPEATLRHSV